MHDPPPALLPGTLLGRCCTARAVCRAAAQPMCCRRLVAGEACGMKLQPWKPRVGHGHLRQSLPRLPAQGTYELILFGFEAGWASKSPVIDLTGHGALGFAAVPRQVRRRPGSFQSTAFHVPSSVRKPNVICTSSVCPSPRRLQ